ncbi:MAG: FAD binding domain-containing protein [Pseudomonadota bacterium]|nr:FAD binding domain-containing protein [Pseudomonadota bacterium]
MTPFELVEPKTLKEAAGLLDPDDPTIRPLGGGTALMLMMKAGLYSPSVLVSLQKVEDGHRHISLGADGSLLIGALTPLRALELSEIVPAVVRRTMTTLSNVRVRNVATVGGCLAHGDPHLDLPPVMMMLGASVTVVGPEGEREIRVEDLYEGYYETSLASNELIATVNIPAVSDLKATYKKVTTRSSDDWPALGVAISLIVEGDDILNASVVISAATEKPMRMAGAETLLAGATAGDALLKQVGDAAADEADLISDPQGSAAYKRELLRVTVGRAVRAALDGEAD